MWEAIFPILGAIAAIIVWWLKKEPSRKRQWLDLEVKKNEAELAEALYKHDADTIARCNKRLRELREERRRLSAK
jgi:recombinational DNA repair ATPase RecF